MAEWTATDLAGTSDPQPVWFATDATGSSVAAGGPQWRVTDTTGESTSAASAKWRATGLSVQALSPAGSSFLHVVGRDGNLYPAHLYVRTPSGDLA